MDPSDLSDFTEEELQQLAELGIIPDQLSMLDRQYKTADALRSTPMPEGRNSGRVYTAANPMEAVGALMQQYAGKRQASKIERKNEKFLNRQADTRNMLMGKWAGIQPGISSGIAKGGYEPQMQAPDMGVMTDALGGGVGRSTLGPNPLESTPSSQPAARPPMPQARPQQPMGPRQLGPIKTNSLFEPQDKPDLQQILEMLRQSSGGY